jgi:GSH-dependent disulfide-bond oxidoreductase
MKWDMLELYCWATPNSNRVSILLEELALPYAVRPVNVRKHEQFTPEILSLNPYGKVPILVDRAGAKPAVLFESGAMLLHLAERHHRLLPRTEPQRAEVLTWFMAALTWLGPYTGQARHWTELAPDSPAVARLHHVGLVARLYRVLDEHLTGREWLAHDYSIADVATFPWIARHAWADLALADYPDLRRWYDRVAARPAVRRGMAVPVGVRPNEESEGESEPVSAPRRASRR